MVNKDEYTLGRLLQHQPELWLQSALWLAPQRNPTVCAVVSSVARPL